MIKKLIVFCLAALVIFSLFAGISGCTPDKKGSGKDDNPADGVKDAMNEAFEDSDMTEEEIEAQRLRLEQ